MHEWEQPLNARDVVRALRDHWGKARVADVIERRLSSGISCIAGSAHDQLTPKGVDNPYWEAVRWMPTRQHWSRSAPAPDGYSIEVPFYREYFVRTWSWAIPTPADLEWIGGILRGRGVVEVGAGAGYWAWQMQQVGVDVVAYEPCEPDENRFTVAGEPYHPVRRGDASAVAAHPDRALFLCWPNYEEPWAFEALSTYRGDLLIYAGEMVGGCCADDDFFGLLDKEWEEIGESAGHCTWWGINCNLRAYRRTAGRDKI